MYLLIHIETNFVAQEMHTTTYLDQITEVMHIGNKHG